MSKKTRIKITQPVLRTRAEAEATVRHICELRTDFQAAEAEMNAAVTAAKKKFEDQFAPIEKLIMEKSALVQAWAEANPSDFNGARSLDMIHGLIGWRTGQPQLKTLTGWTWDRVLENLKTNAFWKTFIRTKEEVDKQKLIGAREDLGSDRLLVMGVKVIQEEAFFIEPKLEQTETRITAQAA